MVEDLDTIARHAVYLYEDDGFLIDTASRWVGAGLVSGEAVVVIATPAHRGALEEVLESRGLTLSVAREQGRYVALDAADTLAQFVAGDVVDELRFTEVVGGSIARASAHGSRVRAFGEMVGLLWAEGEREIALRLERLWSEIGNHLPFSLLSAFDGRVDGDEVRRMFGEHSNVLASESDAAPRVAAHGAIPSMVLLHDDLSDRRRAEEARMQLAAIVESSEDAIVGKTLEGVVTSWNAGAERIFGYSAEEMIGQSISRLVPPNRADDVGHILSAIGRGERVGHFETERIRKDGSRIDVSLTVSPIRDSIGRVVGASKIARDVSDRKKTELERQRIQRELATLHEIGQAIAAERDSGRLLQMITDAATLLSGAEVGAYIDRAGDAQDETCELYAVSGGPLPAFDGFGAEIFSPAFAGQGAVRVADVRHDPRWEHRVPLGGGPVASYMTVPVVGRSGQLYGGLFLGHAQAGVFTEAAERVVVALAAHAAVALDNVRLYEAEHEARSEAEQANRAKDDFLAMLGHELRNPLASVQNGIVAATLDPIRRPRALEIARRGADQLSRLVDDLLDVARITRGHITLREEPVALAGVVELAVDLARPLFEERGVALTVSMPAPDLEVWGDAARLEQVVGNLLTNAAKYTEPGGRVVVTLAAEGGGAVLGVRDSGIGIAPPLLARVFDLFMQADQALDRAEGGLGIGLTLVKQIVELHGGRVEAYSEGLGRGAEFVVRLPARERIRTGLDEGAAPSLERRAAASVLIVEDNLDAAESMMMLLELLGHRVRMVSDGLSALQAARANPPQVMLVDIGLPGMDGYQLAERVRQEESLRHVTLVAMTGYGRDEDRQRALAAGFDHHLVKPVDVQKVQSLVARLVEDRTVH